MSDFFTRKTFIFGFQIHHIIPEELFVPFGTLFDRVGLELDQKGNKVALVTGTVMQTLLAAAPEALQNLLFCIYRDSLLFP